MTGDPGEIREAQELRVEVFCREQGIPYRAEIDGLDPDAIHVVAVDGCEVVGACRLLYEGDALRLGRMAVAEARRGEGIGRSLLERAEGEATRRGAREVVLHAQAAVAAFYEHRGYEVEVGPFAEQGIEHVRMRKRLRDPSGAPA